MIENPKTPEPVQEIRNIGYSQGHLKRGKNPLALESSLEVVVNDKPHSLLMQTPGAETELLTGFLFTEGLIESPKDIGAIRFTLGSGFLGTPGLRAEVDLPGLDLGDVLPDRPALSLASCGLCGKETLEQLGRGISRVRSKHSFTWPVLFDLLQDLRSHQPLYQQTRGVHAAALYRADGSFVGCFEDVGRHNALDKVIGHGLREGWSFEDKLALLSGRASLEMVLKAARAGFPLLLCFSSPTVLAVEAAKVLNLTLVGRQEDRSLLGYTHARRIKMPGE